MKKKTTLALVLSLCMAAFSLTACSNIKGIYDFFSDSDFAGLTDDLSGIDDDSESSGYNYDFKTDADDSSSANSNFDLGNVDGNIYSNSFLGLMCEYDSSWHFYSDKELALINNFTFDNLAEAGYEQMKKHMENGTTYIIMYAQNLSNGENVNISLLRSPLDYSGLITVEDMMDATIPELDKLLVTQGYENISISRGTASFLGETVPCINLAATLDGSPIYQKQVVPMFNKYNATITATSYISEENTQEYLDAFSAY